MATPATGLTARVTIGDLPAGQDIFYRVRFEDPSDPRIASPWVDGHMRTAPGAGRPVRIAWSADTCGQGWGIDQSRGGMRLFETMRAANPDLFLNVGDTIYADQPLKESVPLDDGTVWRNVVTPAKTKVAETLDEFRGNHLYNRLDDHYRRFAAEVGQVAMWDDHEVRDNWYHEQILGAQAPYQEKRVAVLAERARQAFVEHYPIAIERGRHTTHLPDDSVRPARGDLRARHAQLSRREQSQPADHSRTRDGLPGAAADRVAGRCAHAIARRWKIVAADMPLGLVVAHQPGFHEAVANGDNGPPLGREFELAGLLSTLQARRVRNVVWITADVHYCAAHHYDPQRAKTADFDPFWEFVAGRTRRHVRAAAARRNVRTGGAILRRARRPATQPAAQRGPAVFRIARSGSALTSVDRFAAEYSGATCIHTGLDAERLTDPGIWRAT